jgi:hypothetical protein
MPTLKQLPGAVRYRAQRELKTRLVRSNHIPRYAYRHYFIETGGLHSRVHVQNFYSTMWPHLEEPMRVRVEVSAASGGAVGQIVRDVPPFGSLFLDVADLLEEIGAHEPEGSVLVDTKPPASVLADLTSFPLPDQFDLLLGSPFWMAYFDADENYMYVHSISPEMGRYYGVPGPVGRFLIHEAAKPAGRWRAGRLIDADGLTEMQIVLANHAGSRRVTTLGIFDARDDAAVWQVRLSLAPHEVRRVRVDEACLDAFRAKAGGGRFRVGMDELPTSNGKPYLLMRYGTGPLSLHHG